MWLCCLCVCFVCVTVLSVCLFCLCVSFVCVSVLSVCLFCLCVSFVCVSVLSVCLFFMSDVCFVCLANFLPFLCLFCLFLFLRLVSALSVLCLIWLGLTNPYMVMQHTLSDPRHYLILVLTGTLSALPRYFVNICVIFLKAVFRIRIRLDPFHFGLPDPLRVMPDTVPGSQYQGTFIPTSTLIASTLIFFFRAHPGWYIWKLLNCRSKCTLQDGH